MEEHLEYVHECRKLVNENDFNLFKQSFDKFDIDHLSENNYNQLLFSILKNVEFFKYALSIRDLQNYETCFLNAFYNRYKDTFEYMLDKVDPNILLNKSVGYIKDGNRYIVGCLLDHGYIKYHGHAYIRGTGQKVRYSHILQLLSSEIIINSDRITSYYHNGKSHPDKNTNHFCLLYILSNKSIYKISFLKWLYWRYFRNVDKEYFDNRKEVLHELTQMDQDEMNMINVIHSIITNESLTNLPMFDANCFLKVLPYYIVYKN